MHHPLETRAPFSFAQSLTFIRRFPPCQGDYLLDDDAVTAAVAIAGRPVAFTLRGADRVMLEVEDGVDPTPLVTCASHWIGADDDVASLYAAADGDPPFRALIASLHGLHHVRFLTLGEIAVYCVMMQRTPVTHASRMKRAFLTTFGLPIEVRGHVLHAMPELADLVNLGAEAIGVAIRHRRKGELIAGVVNGVAALGETFLRTAPYAQARDALLAIPGIGPFSAGAILLRGLGRMDELPSMEMFADDARVVYGRDYDAAAIARRYGKHIGYWSFYLKTGVARMHVPDAGRVRRMMAPSRA